MRSGECYSLLDLPEYMLIGSYLGVLSEARRIAIPKKFIAELGERPVLAKWYENCLILVNNGFWEDLSKRLTGGEHKFGIVVRDIERFILGSAYELEPDDQGRVIVPDDLVKYAKFTKEVVFIGLLDRVEVWPKEVWDEKSGGLQRLTKEYLENLSRNEKR